MRVRLRWVAVGGVAVVAVAATITVVQAAAALVSIGLGPVLNTPTVAGSSVSVTFIDRATREDTFVVRRRQTDGQWVDLVNLPTGNKAGTGGSATFVDSGPNVLRCYQVVARDNGGSFEPSLSKDVCVNGGLDPFDAQTYAAFPKIAATSLDTVAVAGTAVTVAWTDRSTDEDGYGVYRRDATVPNWLANHNPRGGDLVAQPGTTSKASVGQRYTFVDTIPAGGHRWCYYVTNYNTTTSGNNFSNEVCTSPLPALPAPTPGVGTINTPDTTGAADRSRISGVTSSVTIGTDGLPLISYKTGGIAATGNEDLVVAHCSDANCTAATITSVDTAGYVGMYSSIKIGGDGLGIISYTSARNADGTVSDDVKVAHCSNVACTAATVTMLDSFARVDATTSLTIASDGLATIAYQDDKGPTTKIMVTHCNNPACAWASVSKTVDTVPANGGSGSLPGGVSIAASPTGLFHLGYLSGNGGFKVATCFDPACAVAQPYLADQNVVGATFTGGHPAVAVGRDGLPLFSYFGNGGLSVAHCVNIWCTGITVQTADFGFVGLRKSIAIGADGLGVISHFDGTNNNLRVTHCSDLVCSTTTTTIVDEFDHTGDQPSITIGVDGLPVISYLGNSENTMKVAHCPNPACTGVFVVPF